MAEIVGIFAASHAPPLVRDWATIESGRKDALASAFAELGRRIAAVRPDVLVVIGADHWANFFLNNLPAICIGVGADHGGPPERWLGEYPHTAMKGDPAFAIDIAEALFSSGFEPSLSYEMRLDHAFCVPLWKMGIDPLPAIMPIVINAIQPPLPTVRRCWDFGAALARAIGDRPEEERIVILASGGLSHSVGEPMMGDVDETFDREVLSLFAGNDRDAVFAYLTDERMTRAGNGAAELRFWVAAHGAANGQGFSVIHYEVVPETYTGCGFAEWIRTPQPIMDAARRGSAVADSWI